MLIVPGSVVEALASTEEVVVPVAVTGIDDVDKIVKPSVKVLLLLLIVSVVEVDMS